MLCPKKSLRQGLENEMQWQVINQRTVEVHNVLYNVPAARCVLAQERL